MGDFNPLGAAAGGLMSFGSPMGGLVGTLAGGGVLNPKVSGGGDNPPEIDPRLSGLRDRQYGLAQEFREQAPGLQGQMETNATEQSKLGLDKTNRDITAGANSRGLLYSGMKTAEQAEAGQKAASGLAEKRAGIAKSFSDQQRALDQQAFDSGAKLQDLEQKRYDMVYKNQQAQQQAQQASNTSPLGIVGGVLGAPAGLLGSALGSIGDLF